MKQIHFSVIKWVLLFSIVLLVGCAGFGGTETAVSNTPLPTSTTQAKPTAIPTETALPEPTPTSTSIPPTQTPTSTPTETITPTPLPTLPQDEAVEKVLSLLPAIRNVKFGLENRKRIP